MGIESCREILRTFSFNKASETGLVVGGGIAGAGGLDGLSSAMLSADIGLAALAKLL